MALGLHELTQRLAPEVDYQGVKAPLEGLHVLICRHGLLLLEVERLLQT